MEMLGLVKNLFLLGKIGTGKSSLIRENLLPYLELVGGFFVQRIFMGGSSVAFRLLPVTTAGEYILNRKVETLGGLENIFLFNDGRGNWHSNMEVFITDGTRYLHESIATGKKVILLDEIGGIELHCPPFMEAVMEVLSSPVSVLGVQKAPENAETLEECQAGRNVAAVNKIFFKDLQKDSASELLLVDRGNIDYITGRVKNFVNAAIR
jgi:nucleoside-triphosphatase THEP1